MLNYKEYVLVQSLEEAYKLNTKNNRILGGTGWLKLSDRPFGKAIDLSALGLDRIEENDEEISIGCMVSLRDIEKNEALNSLSHNAVKESLRHIVGTQFRNSVTIGGSIYGRFGFSDVLTMFLVMDSYVELYKGGIIPLEAFSQMPYDNDILVRIIVKKNKAEMSYNSMRNEATDFPVLTCAASYVKNENGITDVRVAVGARPSRAVLIRDEEGILSQIDEQTAERFASYAADKLTFGTNMRASAEYRKHLAHVLIKRSLLMEG